MIAGAVSEPLFADGGMGTWTIWPTAGFCCSDIGVSPDMRKALDRAAQGCLWWIGSAGQERQERVGHELETDVTHVDAVGSGGAGAGVGAPVALAVPVLPGVPAERPPV